MQSLEPDRQIDGKFSGEKRMWVISVLTIRYLAVILHLNLFIRSIDCYIPLSKAHTQLQSVAIVKKCKLPSSMVHDEFPPCFPDFEVGSQ